MKIFIQLVIASVLLAVIMPSQSFAAARNCVKRTTISHDFEQTICPGSENERTTGKTASHSVGIPASCPEGSTSNPTEYTQDDPESGSGVSSGSQSGSGGCSGPNCGGGSYTYTLIAPETCNYPVGNRPTPGDSGNGGNEPNPDPDDNGCGSDKGDNTCKQCEPNKKKSSSDVILTSGTYSFNAVDLHVPARGLEVELKRFYRSNRVLPVSGGIIFGEPIDGPFGYGWTTPYTVKIVDGDTFIDAAGRYFKFEKDSAGRFLTDTQSGQRLEKTSSGYTLTKLDTFTRSFDNDGKLLSKSDNFGNTLTMHYDGGGRLSEVADASGRIALTFTYNSDDRVEMVTDLAGRQVLYEYDGFGNLTGVTDAMDETYSYVYNSYHGLTAKTNPLDQTVWVQYQYADKGVAGKVIDAIGVDNLNRGEEVGEHEQRFVYDFSGGIVYITEKDGRQLKRLINNNGKLTSETEIDSDKTLKKVEYLDNRTEKITDLAGTVVIKKKDEWGNLLRKVDGEGNAWIYTYTSGNRLSSKTAPDGTISRYEYNSQKRVSKKIHAAGTAVEQVTSYEYDQSGQLKAISVNGLTTTYDYNDAGQRIAVTNPAGETQSFEYDGYGYLSAAIDAEGHRSEFSYDKLGHLLEKRTLLDGKTLTTSFTYDALGHLTQQIDPLGHATSYEHDLKGRVTAITDPLLNRSEYVYDGKGNLVQMTQIAPGTDRSRDSVTTMEYDEQSRLIKTIDPEGNSTRYSYSDTVSGCSSCGGSTHTPETITDPFGQVTHNQFDKNGRLIALQTPLDQINNTINTQVYNNVGQVISRTDSNGNTTHYQHNALGQITAQIDANLGQTLYGYDSTGRLKSLTDPEGNTTTFEYDAAGRKSKEIRPLGETTSYRYYRNGLLKSVKDPKGQTTTYTYDQVNRLTRINYDDNSQDSFSYDDNSNLLTWDNGSISGTLVYDELNRKTEEIITYPGFTKSYSYSYDWRGNKNTYTDAEGILHSYEYLKNNRLSKIRFDGQAIDLMIDKTRTSKINYGNGTTTDYGYNENGWLGRIDTQNGTTIIQARDYQFDPSGNINQIGALAGTTSYGYDDLYQLTSADHPETTTLTDETYNYDSNGNRISDSSVTGPISYNPNNELTSHSTVSYEYDNNGNTTKKTEGTGSQGVPVPLVTTYHYNAKNRLTQVDLPDGRTATYSYDPFGRRISKTIGTTTTYYLYADEGLIGEYSNTGSWQKSYGWQPNGMWGTNPLYQRNSTGVYYYHNDHLGTPQRLTSATTGEIVWSAGYQAFGQATVDPLSTVENNLRFPGQYYDQETNLHYNWHRTYDPGTGRYTQVDPIGFIGGINLYVYIHGDPLDGIDPWGLFSLGDARDSLRKKGISREGKGMWKGSYYTNSQVFNEWFGLEKLDQSWLGNLPECPCKKECLDESEWEEPTTNLHGYHVGATECVRSKPVGGHANQCCYDSSGDLITHGSGSGSADYAPGAIPTFFKHKGHDMDPADLASKLDGGTWGSYSERYLEVRPQVGSGKCTKNP